MSEIYTKKYNGFTAVGWIACGVILLIRILVMWVIWRLNLPFDQYNSLSNILSKVEGSFSVLLVISYVNYVRSLPKGQAIPVGILLGASIIFQTVNIFVGINWGSVGFLKGPIMKIPVLILFLMYWKLGILPKLLICLQTLRILLQIIVGVIQINIDMGTPPEIYFTLNRISSYTLMITLVLIAIWFFLGIPKSSETHVDSSMTAPARSVESSNFQSITNTMPVDGNQNGISPSTSGWNHGIPRLAYWCEKCGKSVKYRPKSDNDIEKAHPCPKCGTTLLSWWIEPTRESYFKFAGGGIILFGAFMTIMFETTFGNYGLYPMIMLGSIAIVETLIGVVIMYTGMKIKITAPASYATTTPSIEPQKQFLKEMLILVVLMLTGCFIVYGINMGLISIVF